MKRLKDALCKYAGDLVLLAGAASVTAGVLMIYIPAGLIVGGVLAIAGAVLASMGGGGGK